MNKPVWRIEEGLCGDKRVPFLTHDGRDGIRLDEEAAAFIRELMALVMRSMLSPMDEKRRAKALASFTSYYVSNYPGPRTIISDPQWHAPKILKAAEVAIREAMAE